MQHVGSPVIFGIATIN